MTTAAPVAFIEHRAQLGELIGRDATATALIDGWEDIDRRIREDKRPDARRFLLACWVEIVTEIVLYAGKLLEAQEGPTDDKPRPA